MMKAGRSALRYSMWPAGAVPPLQILLTFVLICYNLINVRNYTFPEALQVLRSLSAETFLGGVYSRISRVF